MLAPVRLLFHRSRPMLKSLGAYTFTNFFGKGVAFLLLPFFTNTLTRSDMGMLNLFSSSIIFLIPFVSMGVMQSVSAEFFKLDKKPFRDLFTTSLILPISVTIITLVAFYFFKDTLQQRYKFPASFTWLVPIVTFLTFFGEHLLCMIRNKDEPKNFMLVMLGRLFIEVSLAVSLILLVKNGYMGRVSGIMVSYLAVAIFASWYFIKNGYLFGKIKLSIIKQELGFSVPIIVMQLSIFCMSASDSFFLSRFTNDNNAEVGVYGIACTFGSVVLTLSSALIQYTFPKIYRALSQPVIDTAEIKKQFKLYFLLMTAGLLTLIIAVPQAYKYFINAAYMPGLRYCYILCVGYYFWSLSFFFYSFLLYHKKKKTIFLLSLLSIAISLTGNYFFIKHFSALGAAISVCLTYFLVLLLTLGITFKKMGFVFYKQRTI